ncbi:hypothetical protein E4T48_07031 [Aureobasidium sp. EXF-10727]|nr:hypothetical protein E4T48_07031 [Aureobasidium sp. EXF-10727]KAI4725034.1 hypothetical protein E4T49_07264 [Aureobasidium sp. EXF-10728]
MSTLSSPALSFCDSLSSPDLEAYLDRLSPLSQLPSPTMKEAWWREEALHGRCDSILSDMSPLFTIAADVLCNITACNSCKSVKPLLSMITRFLDNSRVPMETVALAYNILSQPAVAAMHCWHGNPAAFASGQMSKIMQIHGPESDASCQRALVILSALNVAVSFTEDNPRSLFHWSRQVAEGIFSTEQINAMSRIVLAQLEWSIHPLTAPVAIETALSALSSPGVVTHDKHSSFTPLIVDEEDSLRLILGPQTVIQHGLVTPEPSPDCMHGDDDLMPQYLPASQE